MPPIGPAVAWVVVLLLLASFIGAWIGHLRIPYTVGLVLAGIILDATGLLPPTTFDPDLILFVLLPPLIFQAALTIKWSRLRRVAVAITLLATFGVLLSAIVSGGIAMAVLGMAVGDAAVFAVLVAATDPVSVISLFREARVDPNLRALVEGESLVNDGTVVVLVGVVVAWIGQGKITAFGAIEEFLWVSLGGIAVGAAVGLAGAVVTPRRDDYLLEATISISVAYGGYLLAQEFGLSGILATVAAGSVLGNAAPYRGVSPSTREWIEKLWEFMAFVANSFVFLLLGIAVAPSTLILLLPAIGVGVVAAVAGRIACVYPIGRLSYKLSGVPPRRWEHILVIGGLRGALPVVIALSLAHDTPRLVPVAELVLGVVVVSLILQGIALEPAVRLLLPNQAGETTSE